MKFEQKGNLGKLDLLERHLEKKLFNSNNESSVELSREEIEETLDQLAKFKYLLSNVFLNKNSLENDQYRGFLRVINELEEYYRDYKGENNE